MPKHRMQKGRHQNPQRSLAVWCFRHDHGQPDLEVETLVSTPCLLSSVSTLLIRYQGLRHAKADRQNQRGH